MINFIHQINSGRQMKLNPRKIISLHSSPKISQLNTISTKQITCRIHCGYRSAKIIEISQNVTELKSNTILCTTAEV